jgi:protein-S-isoprenylcysteine O-methyltransferase Ste14
MSTDKRDLLESSAPDVFGVLAVGYRSGTSAAQLRCRFRGIGRVWLLVFWPRRQGERMMLQTFGDSYRAYMERTGKIFPSIR